MKWCSKVGIVASMVVFSAAASAGSVNLDFRGDAQSQTVNDPAWRANYGRDNYKFFINTARIDAKGKLNDKTSFRARFRFTDTAASKTVRDNTTNMLDIASVNYKFSDMFSMNLGKMATDIDGIEGATSGPDLYLTSQAYGDTSNERYMTGGKVTATAFNTDLSIFALNQSADTPTAATSTTYNQNRNMFGVQLKSQFLGKIFQPNLGYFDEDTQNTTSKNRGDTFLNAGFKTELMDFVWEFDYLMHSREDKTTTRFTDTVESYVAQLSYGYEQWTPKVKYESSKDITYTTTSGTRYEYNGYQIALEYKPVSDENLRYHIAWFEKERRPETGDTQILQTFLAGIRINADFMK